MAAQKKEPQINLLPREGFYQTAPGRVITWLLTSFRIIVIITEIIVVIAFFSRFYLDAKNTDLNETISQKQASIAALRKFEDQYRTYQNKLLLYSQLNSFPKMLSETTGNIVRSKPSDVTLKSIIYDGSKFNIQAYSLDEKSIQQFMANLSGTENFDQVTLGEVSASISNASQMDFNISVSTKEQS